MSISKAKNRLVLTKLPRHSMSTSYIKMFYKHIWSYLFIFFIFFNTKNLIESLSVNSHMSQISMSDRRVAAALIHLKVYNSLSTSKSILNWCSDNYILKVYNCVIISKIISTGAHTITSTHNICIIYKYLFTNIYS